MAEGTNGLGKHSLGIVIRTWNEAGFLEKCIKALKSQKMDLVSSLEIQVIDSYSTDGTIELSKREGCTLIEIPKSEFNYGGSLNTGIDALDKELIISLSAHAIPQDDGFFNALIKPFEDPGVAGTYVKQVPWPDAPFHEKIRVLRTFDDIPRTFNAPKDPEMHFSNVASCFRKSFWAQQGFHALPSSEDLYWAEAMLEKGHSIVYVTSAAVFHSHVDSCKVLAKRFYTILRNELETNKRPPLRENLRVFRAALSHIKSTTILCLTEKGGFREKSSTFLHCFVEAALIMDQHFSRNKK